jgi:hypothetical protein
MLYRGIVVNNVPKSAGLLECAGLDSEKHAGQLKRIAGPAIALVKWLITFTEYGNDNIFYDRFVQLSEADYIKMNFSKHINQDIKSQTTSRLGSSADAYLIITIITRDHRNPDTGEQDPLELIVLIPEKIARDKYQAWLQMALSSQVHPPHLLLSSPSSSSTLCLRDKMQLNM